MVEEKESGRENRPERTADAARMTDQSKEKNRSKSNDIHYQTIWAAKSKKNAITLS